MSSSTLQYPYDTIVRITDAIGGVAWQGSGVLIAPDEVLTAAHIVYMQGVGTASNIVVTPADDGTAPLGTANGTNFHYWPIADANDLISFYDSQNDYAVIHLDHPFSGLGFMGLQADFAGGSVTLSGYPASARGGMVNSSQVEYPNPYYSLLDGYTVGPGSSGGPVWITNGLGQPYVVGIVSSGNSTNLQGHNTLITTSAFNTIEGWLQADQGSPALSPTEVRNNAGNVSTDLAQLESRAQQGTLTLITLTDPGLPTLKLSLAALLGGTDALHFIGGSFAVDASGTGARGNAAPVLAASLGASTRIVDIQFADGQLVYDPAAPAAQVFRLYQAALGRAPDAAGLYNWINLVKSGAPLTALADGFIASAEFQIRFGTNLGNGDFISQLYLNVLHRAPDAQGFNGWSAALATGTSRAQVVVGFSESAENKLATAASVQAGIWDLDRNAPPVTRLYDTVFGRLPDAGGLANWDRALDAGVLTLDQAAAQFVQSPEFVVTYGSLSNSAFVTALYANTLHRAPDPGGQAIWTNTLDAGGLSRSGAVLGFSESQEHQNNTADNIFGTGAASLGVRLA